ncbi:MAG: hypothetical protein ABIS36_12740 [Chryseolinea sp.]
MKSGILIIATLLLAECQMLNAQHKSDTIVVQLAKTSKVVLTVGDREDLETLKHYNFQELFQDVIRKLEANDTTALASGTKTDTASVADVSPTTRKEEDWNNADRGDGNKNNDWTSSNNDWTEHVRHSHWGRTWQSFNFDLGTNNYISKGKFPNSSDQLYSVRPWGSWYVGLASIQRTRLGRKFFLEWGGGINWYNFKFEKDNILIQKNDDGISFIEDTRDVHYVKSKLTASYITASLIPVIDFSDKSRKARIWDGYGNAFRIGLGPYVGYRISSHSKLVYKDGDREKQKDHDSFYLNNVRYGLRLQLGFRSTDFFFNYDLNNMFTTKKGPDLNAFSFGVVF